METDKTVKFGLSSASTRVLPVLCSSKHTGGKKRGNARRGACAPQMAFFFFFWFKDRKTEGGAALNYTSCTRAALGLH